MLANTFGHYKTSRRWTLNNRSGQQHNQIDCILVRKRFRSGVNIARTRHFPGADTGSDHDLLMMTFHLRPKRTSKPKHKRPKFVLEKLKDRNVLEVFRTRSLNLSSLLMSTTFNTAVTETASLILGKHRQKKRKKNWVTREILDRCDKVRELRRKYLNLKDLSNTRK